MTKPRNVPPDGGTSGDQVDGGYTTAANRDPGRSAASRGRVGTPRTGVRARALKHNEAHIIENITWTDQLEAALTNLGLLRQHVFGQVRKIANIL